MYNTRRSAMQLVAWFVFVYLRTLPFIVSAYVADTYRHVKLFILNYYHVKKSIFVAYVLIVYVKTSE